MPGLTTTQRERAASYVSTAGAIARGIAFAWNLTHLADDLRSMALVALSKAAQKFDPSRPAKFTTYAWRRVTGTLLDAADKESKRIALEVALDVAEDIPDRGEARDVDEAIDWIDVAAADVMDAIALACAGASLRSDAEAELLRAETRAQLERALATLAPDHRRQFELRHGDGLRWAVIEAQLGVPERTLKDRDPRIREALRKALRGERG